MASWSRHLLIKLKRITSSETSDLLSFAVRGARSTPCHWDAVVLTIPSVPNPGNTNKSRPSLRRPYYSRSSFSFSHFPLPCLLRVWFCYFLAFSDSNEKGGAKAERSWRSLTPRGILTPITAKPSRNSKATSAPRERASQPEALGTRSSCEKLWKGSHGKVLTPKTSRLWQMSLVKVAPCVMILPSG